MSFLTFMGPQEATEVQGSLSATLDAMTLAAAVAVAGSADVTFGALTLAGTGTVSDAVAPSVQTVGLANIPSPTVLSVNGDVVDDGGGAIIERGICWSTSLNPTVADSKATADGTTGAFEATATGLSGGTGYHVRAYATNAVGTSYGADLAVVAGWGTYLSSSHVSSSSAWSRTVTVKAGDLILVSYHQVTTGSFTHNAPTDSQENAYTSIATVTNPAGAGRTSAFWGRASADGSLTVTGTTSGAGACVFAIHVFTGICTFGNPVRNVQTGQGTSASPATSSAVTVAAGDLLCCAATINDSGAGPLAAGSDFTLRQSVEGTFEAGTETYQVPSGSTHAGDMAAAGSGKWSIIGVSFKKAVVSEVSASLTATLEALTLAGAGAVQASASAAITLGEATVAASGAVAVHAVCGDTLGAATLVASALVTNNPHGALDETLQPLTVTGSGTVAVTGSLAVTLAPLTRYTALPDVIVVAAVVATQPSASAAAMTPSTLERQV
ncbi:hypothetical protein LLG88_13615 [bacterium]|nr:hypothetical protein [bacterium]